MQAHRKPSSLHAYTALALLFCFVDEGGGYHFDGLPLVARGEHGGLALEVTLSWNGSSESATATYQLAKTSSADSWYLSSPVGLYVAYWNANEHGIDANLLGLVDIGESFEEFTVSVRQTRAITIPSNASLIGFQLGTSSLRTARVRLPGR